MEVMKHFAQTQTRRHHIRPWDLLARLDGSVESLAILMFERESVAFYPTCFQIPLDFLHGLDHHENVTTVEMSVIATLLKYVSGKKPFEGLTDNKVQPRFAWFLHAILRYL